MDEDLAAINANTRNQKVKDFFIKFKKHLIITIQKTSVTHIL